GQIIKAQDFLRATLSEIPLMRSALAFTQALLKGETQMPESMSEIMQYIEKFISPAYEQQLQKQLQDTQEAQTNKFNIKKCLGDSGLDYKVYAAEKDEEEGGSCPWYLRAPWKVMGNVVLVGGLSTLLSDSTGYVFATLQRYLAFLTLYKPPPIPPSQQLVPLFEQNGMYCRFGACSVGCGANKECGSGGVCCQLKPVINTCSLKGNVHYKFDNTNSRIQEESEIDIFLQAGIAEESYIEDNTSITYCKQGQCDPEKGCVQEVARCENIGDIDVIGGAPFRCDESGFWKQVRDYSTVVSLFVCSADLTSITDVRTGNILQRCDGNAFCDIHPTFQVPFCESIARQYRCSVNQQIIDGGFQCTTFGKRCEPGKQFEYSYEYPCARKCNADGTNWEIMQPETCAPSTAAYIDRICKGNDVYILDSSQKGKAITKHVETCRNGCSNGLCLERRGSTCSVEDKIVGSTSGDCPLQCQNGEYKVATFCNHVDVVPYNNANRLFIYETLAKLPANMFDGVHIPVIMDWHFAGSYVDIFRTAGFSPGHYQGTDQAEFPHIWMITPFQEASENTLVHEYIHAWIDAKLSSQLVFLEQPNLVNIPENLRKLYYPSSYMNDIIGCVFDGSKFSYTSPPVTDYASTPERMGCNEDFADSAAWYVTNACELKKLSPDRYDYFRDTIFQGKEYIPAEGCN
ncbi:MAG: hypothetical protein ABH856_01930, partial [Patescibacteria group bacterium]